MDCIVASSQDTQSLRVSGAEQILFAAVAWVADQGTPGTLRK